MNSTCVFVSLAFASASQNLSEDSIGWFGGLEFYVSRMSKYNVLLKYRKIRELLQALELEAIRLDRRYTKKMFHVLADTEILAPFCDWTEEGKIH